ncbi:MAG: DUF1588 domain-containing protein [Fuerstiella sp.]
MIEFALETVALPCYGGDLVLPFTTISAVGPPPVIRCLHILTLMVFSLIDWAVPVTAEESAFRQQAQPFLQQYCVACHSADEVHGDVDFGAIQTAEQVAEAFDIWERAVTHVQTGTMPPEDEDQPTAAEKKRFIDWYQHLLNSVEAEPAVFRPRRLSVIEYRNTLKSVLGFDLEVAIIQAEQTVAERSLVVKLLPTDPPGQSGFKNDTHSNPLTTVVWDQYSFLVDAAIAELFSETRQSELAALISATDAQAFKGELITKQQAQSLLETITERAQRRQLSSSARLAIAEKLSDQQPAELAETVRFEIKAVLMSAQFMYRGLLMQGTAGQRQTVDDFELAERMSYFLWGDMPDRRLMDLASNRSFADGQILKTEIDRMLADAKAGYLTEVFATEWFTLNEIEKTTDDVPRWVALKAQPLDFMKYLFTEDRPLLELIDSKTAFINPYTAKMYGKDAKQMTRQARTKGIERAVVANQRIELRHTAHRGGILTMPGILAMNRGPIIRGTWMLERVLGEELPEPPANVGQVPQNKGGQTLSFRERFEQHRSNSTCAVCHDRIDPLGFALESYGDSGQFMTTKAGIEIDTSGQLPSGEAFENFAQLKQILTTTQKEAVIRNMVERTLSFGLCRQLTIFDRPEVERLTREMVESNGSWRDLFLAIVNSVPFRETVLADI